MEPEAFNLVEVKERLEGRLALPGNIDLGAYVGLSKHRRGNVELGVRIRDLAPGGGHCLGSSNTTGHVLFDD